MISAPIAFKWPVHHWLVGRVPKMSWCVFRKAAHPHNKEGLYRKFWVDRERPTQIELLCHYWPLNSGDFGFSPAHSSIYAVKVQMRGTLPHLLSPRQIGDRKLGNMHQAAKVYCWDLKFSDVTYKLELQENIVPECRRTLIHIFTKITFWKIFF